MKSSRPYSASGGNRTLKSTGLRGRLDGKLQCPSGNLSILLKIQEVNMPLLKKLTMMTIFLSGLFCGLSGHTQSPALDAGQVDKLSCSEAFDQLKVKIEMNQQLGQAYLQTLQTLGDVYSTWGSQLIKLTSPQALPTIGSFFLNSAATTKTAVAQSRKAVEELSRETSLLMDRVSGCVKN